MGVNWVFNGLNRCFGPSIGPFWPKHTQTDPNPSVSSDLRKLVGLLRFSGKFVGINYALLPNRQWNKKQKHKKQPWSNVECFAFGVGIVRFASLETSFHAANHTIPPPPSYEGYPLCPKDKNRSPFHGEKPLVTKWFLGKKPHQTTQNDNQHLGRGVIFHIRLQSI